MSGAFVAVSDDATSTWWNPAGLATGGFFNAVLEVDRVEDSSHTRARAFSLTVPSLGLSYYRLSLSGMQVTQHYRHAPREPRRSRRSQPVRRDGGAVD